jgi:hypothetical protein
VFLAVKNQRVSGVRTALKTCDDVVLRGEDVDNFAFSFIAPLEAQEHIYLHVNSFLLRLIRIAFTKVQKCSILLDFPTPFSGLWKKEDLRVAPYGSWRLLVGLLPCVNVQAVVQHLNAKQLFQRSLDLLDARVAKLDDFPGVG